MSALIEHKLLSDLLTLSHQLGSPNHDWAMLGEGNTSVRFTDDSFLVKASGSQLATLTEKQVVEVEYGPVLEALSSDREFTDAEVKKLLLSACVDPKAGMPSVETLIHAYLLSLPGIQFVGHTHVTSINGVICSERGWELVQSGGRLFPDEIVVCGSAPCCVPYVDPGFPLARALKQKVHAYIEKFGMHPKTIYLRNHGFIALGKSATEVVSITAMADKSAQILQGTMAFGGPTFLTPENVDRIATRPDEHYRQQALGLKTS